MRTTYTVEYDQTGHADVLAAASTGDDRDPLLAAELAYNAAVERLTGVNPGVRFEYGEALDDLLRTYGG